ncbi:MAG: glycoside hydrolase family 97 protein [Prevotellaceae bacterium]|jgi:alpha-glucosidase|nr:glycoside hydrolase family 97 protein [Prevotellaceae bacterium]
MKRIKLIFIIILTIIIAACSNNSKEIIVSSPDGNIFAEFELKDGKPYYRIVKNNEQIIDFSQLGFELNGKTALNGNFVIKNTSESSFDETWEQTWGEEILVRNHYNELTVELQESKGEQRLLTIIFRVFDDGVGFRYVFPEQPNLTDFEIIDELTEFALTEDSQAWHINAYKGEYYENLYKKLPVSKINDTVSTPLTIETGNGHYITIHEANLTDYAAMNLYPKNNSTTLKAELTPWSTGVKVYTRAPFATPWRTIILADNLNALVNSRIMLNLNEPCKIENTDWIKPAKYIGIWWEMHMEKSTWSQGAKHGANTNNVLSFIDFAAANNVQGVLVEGWNYGWDGTWSGHGEQFSFTKPYPDFDIKKITDYAAKKGVELIGHNETGGATINYENQLEDAFTFYKKYGVNTVKTGYVARFLDGKERHSSQYGVRHYRKVIETAARYQIMIDNHEPVMPTGLQRTYPNLMAQEGVRGQEYDAWSKDGGNPPEHTCIVPFTRGLAGSVDFTFGTFNFTNPVNPQTRVQTTIAKQLALYVVIYSPLQMASDLPENYNGNSAFEFISAVPVDWAKTIIKDGKIGEYVVTVRKDKYSNDWFMGAITNAAARNVKVDFSFLEDGKKYKAKIFKDAPDADWKTNPYAIIIEEQEIDATTVIDLNLASGGGTAIWIKAE